MGRKKAKNSSGASTSTQNSRIASLRDGIEQDNETIRMLEKKLGFKKRKNASARCFDDFGLGDIWSIIEKVEPPTEEKDKGSKAKGKKRKQQPIDDDEFSDDNAMENDEQLDDRITDESADDGGDEQEGSDEEQPEPEFKEDIYGRLRDKEGNIIKGETSTKEFDSVIEDEIDERAMKRIRGLLNRLSASNLMTISSSIEDILKEYSLFQVTQCLSKCIDNQLIQPSFLSPQRLIGEYAMLISVLNTNIGDEIGGHVVHQFIKRFNTLMNGLTDSNEEEESKSLDNLVAFVAYLHACGMINSDLVFDIIDKMTNRFNNKCIQVILMTLRMVGFVLRRSDPSRLKKMIVDIQSQASKFETVDKRIMFMLEALAAIKNNNITKLNSLNEDSPISSVDINTIRTTIKNGLRAKTSVSCIPGKYDEVIQSNRWWIKSGLLLEESKTETKKLDEEPEDISKSDAKLINSDICETLCAKLRLVTPLRKLILKSLITCEDYIECTQRLIKVGGKNFIEVMNVCLLVALREKKFNPFYIHLFKQLSSGDRKYKLALIYSFRDRLNEPDRLSKVEKNNMCKYIVELLKLDVIPITVLKNFQFNDLSEESIDLLKSILIPVFTSDESTITKVLSKLKPKDPFTVALKLFITCFMDPQYKEKMLFLKK